MVNARVEDQLVEALARRVVGEVSPAELPLFRDTATRYFGDPQGTMTARRSREETLGFGAETAVVLLGPFALELAKKVVTQLLEKVGDAAADGLAARLLGWLRPAATPKGPEPLDAAQLALVRETAGAEATRLALPPADAARLADALVASLAIRT